MKKLLSIILLCLLFFNVKGEENSTLSSKNIILGTRLINLEVTTPLQLPSKKRE